MKIVFTSNSPLTPTGYGNQTKLFTRLMKQAGHDVIVRGMYGHHNGIIDHNGVPILPVSYSESGSDVLAYDWMRHKPDVGVVLYDAWVYPTDVLDKVPLTCWAPIDHQPAPPQVIDRLKHFRWVWAMSRFGERMLRQEGIDPFYVPHGVNTETYKPIDREPLYDRLGINTRGLFVVFNGANKGYPSRKHIDKILKAWAIFVQKQPDALLYLHTQSYPSYGGYDIVPMINFYNIPEKNIRMADPHMLRDGEINEAMLNALYNAADVMLSPSAGEGFGIPALEAQAAGCPVIVSDFSAQSELGQAGYKIPVDSDDLYYTQQGSEQAWIRASAIVKSLEWAVEQRGNLALRQQARDFSLAYDAKLVFERFMLPSLKLMAQMNADIGAKAA